MTKAEIKKALALLGDRVSRSETAGIDGGGMCLTVFWRDGGQMLFYALDQVETWIAEKHQGWWVTSEPYNTGYEARLQGDTDNPYPDGTQDRANWVCGWIDSG